MNHTLVAVLTSYVRFGLPRLRFDYENYIFYYLRPAAEETVFRPVRKFAKREYYLRNVCPAVCPRRTTWLLLDGFS
jgi:hypothetical protein